MSIATEITRLQNAKAALKESIEAKGVTVEDSAKLDEYPALVDSISQGGGGGVEGKDVNFYDYDGTCLYSYTKDEFLALNEMPANPGHSDEGLISDGWNFILANAKSIVQKYGFLNIGQLYTPINGDTYIIIEIDKNNIIEEVNLHLSLTSNAGSGTIDWGDGTENAISSSTESSGVAHRYLQIGIYRITLKSINCKITRTNNSAIIINNIHAKSIIKVHFGSNIQHWRYSLLGFTRLKAVTYSASTSNIYALATSEPFYNLLCFITPIIQNADYGDSFQAVNVLCNQISDVVAGIKAIKRPNPTNKSLGGTSMVSITFTEDITSINNGSNSAFKNTVVYSYATIPPNLTVSTSSYIPTIIYVPAESVEAYKTATNWSNYANKIFPIPTE